MHSVAAPPDSAAPPRSGGPSVVSWLMLAVGVTAGLAAGQYAAGRAVQEDLYALKRDVAEVRQSADALTAAGGRSDEVASLLDNLRAQRVAVKEADETWRVADAMLSRTVTLRQRSDTALKDAKDTAEFAEVVAEAVAGALEGTRAARDAATETEAVLAEIAATGEQTVAAREAVAVHRVLLAEQAETFAAARAALESARDLGDEAEAVQIEANAAANNLRAARRALTDRSRLTRLLADASAGCSAAWQRIDGLLSESGRDALVAFGELGRDDAPALDLGLCHEEEYHRSRAETVAADFAAMGALLSDAGTECGTAWGQVARQSTAALVYFGELGCDEEPKPMIAAAPAIDATVTNATVTDADLAALRAMIRNAGDGCTSAWRSVDGLVARQTEAALRSAALPGGGETLGWDGLTAAAEAEWTALSDTIVGLFVAPPASAEPAAPRVATAPEAGTN